jgi:hypothetical protein
MTAGCNPFRHWYGETSTRSVTTCGGKPDSALDRNSHSFIGESVNEDAQDRWLCWSRGSCDHVAGSGVRYPAGQHDFSPCAPAGTNRQHTFQSRIVGSLQFSRPSPIFGSQLILESSSVGKAVPIITNPWMKKNSFVVPARARMTRFS